MARRGRPLKASSLEDIHNLCEVSLPHVLLLGLDVNPEGKKKLVVTVVDDTGAATFATTLGLNPYFEDGTSINSFQKVILAWTLFTSQLQIFFNLLTQISILLEK